jgi:hypothetical protein
MITESLFIDMFMWDEDVILKATDVVCARYGIARDFNLEEHEYDGISDAYYEALENAAISKWNTFITTLNGLVARTTAEGSVIACTDSWLEGIVGPGGGKVYDKLWHHKAEQLAVRELLRVAGIELD